ncbi:hypothetical protein METBIDRAFT_31283 [Metschnikowia bicuspidata var. bicuspidata NRRL YB-4993]|uniref:Uncharacterized protein n=1 Tax=Metschnikowia bicuspidata var. bicuspidata NRRL YB-4993 TaxID=869754 RepID=A0A1A0HEQ6_9ASCO|nr:hypothetical protein METBIDRAFT_31283 [Metschnikowia bicuspidata var. bicuspidata NRRL YB-4993]OBA22372.1 hypothetical protein METBIDRAFT_31283 [Metschnikowia bicuspidata var. bicuspidata NRRL YB-4993]
MKQHLKTIFNRYTFNEKSLIIHATTKPARFPGYDISVASSGKRSTVRKEKFGKTFPAMSITKHSVTILYKVFPL